MLLAGVEGGVSTPLARPLELSLSQCVGALLWGWPGPGGGPPGLRPRGEGFLSRMTLREGLGEGQGRGVLAGKGDPRGEAIWASVERRQRPGLREPWQGHLGSRTFPGPERGARNSSPGVGGRGGQFPDGSPALAFPRSPGYGRWNTRPRLRGTGPRAGQSPAVDPRRGAQRPREGARGYRPRGPRPGRALGGWVGGAAPGSPPPAPGSPRPSPRAPPLPLVLGPPGEPGRAAWALRSR